MKKLYELTVSQTVYAYADSADEAEKIIRGSFHGHDLKAKATDEILGIGPYAHARRPYTADGQSAETIGEWLKKRSAEITKRGSGQ
jgi:hypothetical protein